MIQALLAAVIVCCLLAGRVATAVLAVAGAATLQELMLPFVRTGGLSIAFKGPGLAQEMTAARRAAFVLGGTVRAVVDAPTPGREDWAHVLLLTDKTGPTPKAYPRRAGTPGKKPLGA